MSEAVSKPRLISERGITELFLVQWTRFIETRISLEAMSRRGGEYPLLFSQWICIKFVTNWRQIKEQNTFVTCGFCRWLVPDFALCIAKDELGGEGSQKLLWNYIVTSAASLPDLSPFLGWSMLYISYIFLARSVRQRIYNPSRLQCRLALSLPRFSYKDFLKSHFTLEALQNVLWTFLAVSISTERC